MSIKPRILYISSASPVKGPGAIGGRHFANLKESGYDVDMLTLYQEPSLSDVMYVKKSLGIGTRIMWRVKSLLHGQLPGRPYYFFYRKEEQPPVPINRVLSKINKGYDLVIIYYWQGLLSFKTVEAIYDKLDHPVVFFFCPDFSHMSGGCHFTCKCLRYQTGCGFCPALNSKDENDFTQWNVNYRKRFYKKVKPVVFGNSYMNGFYQKSLLLKDARIEIYPPTFDVQRYKPIDKEQAKRSIGIAQSGQFVIAFGCQELSDPRKGIDYLIKALHVFKSRLSDEERERILLLVAGKDYENIKSSLPFPSIGVGFLPIDRLSEFYSAADIFMCSSVDDAGPSMVSQSIACGTPVVGFKMGAMLDCVQDKGTGYCAELKDYDGLSDGIEKFFVMTGDEYNRMSVHCRSFALEHSNADVVNYWMGVYEKYR